jgi:hypothetical protein
LHDLLELFSGGNVARFGGLQGLFREGANGGFGGAVAQAALVSLALTLHDRWVVRHAAPSVAAARGGVRMRVLETGSPRAWRSKCRKYHTRGGAGKNLW